MIRRCEQGDIDQVLNLLAIQNQFFDNLFIHFLVEHSQVYPTVATTRRKGTIKQCFMNAFRLATEEPHKYTYVEGYAANIIPVHHAWCVNRDGHVIDPTWKDGGKAYYGIPFNVEYVWKMAGRRRIYGILDGNKELLTGLDTDWRQA